MNRILSMAFKDFRILFRDKLGAFFIIGFPICMGLFFGLMMGQSSSGGGGAKMEVAIVDNDDSEFSRKFIESLKQNDSINLTVDELESAKESVRKGNRVALLVLEKGFGKTVGVFWEDPPSIKIGVDPSRTAESGMLQGFVMEAIGQLAGERFQDVSQMQEFLDNSRQELAADQTISPSNRLLMNAFLGSVESMVGSIESLQTKADDTSEAPNNGNGFQFANIESLDVSRVIDPNSQAGQLSKMQSKWDISFPQAMMWGVMGCVAGFAISIARERSQGTMMRLQVAPVSKFEILAGKAVACFMTVILVIVVLTTLGVVLGMQPKSYGLLAVASFCVAFCFVGIMMVMSVLGRTEASVNGAGWAINMVMAMLGGAMIPVMFMPAVIKQFSVISPIKWGILSLEGAIWREFSFAEMLLPCAIMLGVGAAGLVIGTVILSRSES